MKDRITNRFFSIDRGGVQDLIILGGVFVFFSILIIGLFPQGRLGQVALDELFFYSVMTIPVIAATYFIIMSFRRNLYHESAETKSSLKNRIALAFVFIAIIPVLTLVLASNYIMTHSISNLYFDETLYALNESVDAADDALSSIGDQLEGEAEASGMLIEKGRINFTLSGDRDLYRDMMAAKNIGVIHYYIPDNPLSEIVMIDGDPEFHEAISPFYNSLSGIENIRVDRFSIGEREIACSAISVGNHLVILSRDIPRELSGRRDLFAASISESSYLVQMGKYFEDGISVFLFWLTIFVLSLAVAMSIFISKKITKPVLDLVEASKKLAYGDFNVRLKPAADDEIGLLFNTFNRMVKELDQNRRVTYHKQRLEAWREVARKIVHEIKNPLTPIRLSADRMRKRYTEKHPDIDNIIISGTETISEEIETLMNLLNEFTKFARLPEMQKEPEDINGVLEKTINLFSLHERVNFIFEPDKSLSSVHIDRKLMRQAIINIIQNALDATGYEGEIKIKTELSDSRFERVVRIIISDNGPGIKEDEIENIFEPGFSTKFSGSGLGLSIVEKIIIEHSGTIICNSVYGEGTVFTIELPLE